MSNKIEEIEALVIAARNVLDESLTNDERFMADRIYLMASGLAEYVMVKEKQP